MKKLLFISSFIFCYNASAQELALIFEDTINDLNILKLTSYNSYSSNRFNNDLIDKFLFGGQITTEMKDFTSSKLRGRNVLGGEFEQRIDSYTPSVNFFGKEDYGMKISFSDNHYFSADIRQDLFNTAMYGNANYIGDTMDFTFSSFQYQHYQKVGIGFYHQYNLSSIQLNYVSGSKTMKGALDESFMHSQESLDSIDIVASGVMFQSERFFPYWGLQGNGFAIDIDYNFIFEGKVKNRQIINFKINNLGVIFWNKKSKQYVLNTNDVYSGVDIQDLINQDTTVDNSINWEDTLGISESSGFQVDVLPLELVVQKLADHGIDKRWQAIFGLKVIMVPEYFPYLFGGAYFKASDKLSISSRVSYGGWAGLRWGMNFNYWVKDKLYFSAGSFDLMGLMSKKYGYGRGFNFSMYVKL